MIEKTPRIPIPNEVRQYVFERDRYQCQSCGCIPEDATLQVDHIIALAQGGSNDLSNLQTLCQHCNQKKRHYRDLRFQRRYT